MNADQMIPGMRVRLVRRVGRFYPDGLMFCIEAGATGRVVECPDCAVDGEIIPVSCFVEFDEAIVDLAEWCNMLHVGEESDATPDDFELV
jgi:hypothetical protein